MADTKNTLTAEGFSVDDDDMHWIVNCPKCDREIEYTGFFDSTELNKCRCGAEFLTDKVFFEDGSYMR